MKNSIFLISALFISYAGLTQTGPGGVGNSTTNILWLQPDKISSLTDGADISTWLDQSGNSNHVTQPVAAYTPIYKTNVVNGQPVVRFGKANNRIRKTNFSTFPTTAISAIYVNRNNGESSDGILSYASTAHNNDFLLFSSNRLNIYRINNTNTSLDLNNNNFNIVNVSWMRELGKEEAWKNGSNTYNATGHRTNNSITANGCLSIAGEQDAIDASYDAGQTHFGDFGEVILYNVYLNRAQHIIISNYLSAKYGLSLTANDIYDEDNSGNGDYDFEVAGIGRVDALNLHNHAKGSGAVEILNPSNLGDNEFLLWGHNNALLQAAEVSDVPAGVQARFARVWRASEVSASNTPVDVGAIDVRFELFHLGPITTSDLRLLVDTDNDGAFNDETPISGAADLGGGIYEFIGVTQIANNTRFTIGTINVGQTPLPVELINFNAHIWEGRSVKLDWQTASENNNDYFTLQRTLDGKKWEDLHDIDGAGNSTSMINYTAYDHAPYIDASYYRLKQVDFDGKYSFSDTKSINMNEVVSTQLKIYPNPTKREIQIIGDAVELSQLRIYNTFGHDLTANAQITFQSENKMIIDLSNLRAGVYFVKTNLTTNKVVYKP